MTLYQTVWILLLSQEKFVIRQILLPKRTIKDHSDTSKSGTCLGRRCVIVHLTDSRNSNGILDVICILLGA